MTASRLLARFVRDYTRYGLVNVLSKGVLTLLSYGFLLKVLKCLVLDTPDPHFLDAESRYTGTFLDRDQLAAFAAQPENELSPQFLRAALAKGDACYALLDGPVLASYAWYATTATCLSDTLQLRCDRQYVYLYKAYTPERYRGQRLHAVGVTRALEIYRARGYRGVISYVDAGNLSSLKSCYRMGKKAFGTVYVMKWWGRPVLRHSAGCRAYEVRIEEVREPPLPGTARI